MKLRDFVIAQDALRRILALELPVVISYKLARAARPVEAELRAYERERTKLVRRLGEDTGRGQIMVTPENNAEFNEQIETLLDEEVELENKPMDPAIFDEADAKVRAGDLVLAWFLFEEKEEKDA